MRILHGNIWSFHDDHYIVIPTNIGWKSDGSNVMGAGLALEAAKRYPALPMWYGRQCFKRGRNTAVLYHEESRLILLPVKPLDEEAPYMSWQGNASMKLIRRGLEQLKNLKINETLPPVVLPLVGCGNGGLQVKLVLPIIEECLTDERFTLIHRGEL